MGDWETIEDDDAACGMDARAASTGARVESAVTDLPREKSESAELIEGPAGSAELADHRSDSTSPRSAAREAGLRKLALKESEAAQAQPASSDASEAMMREPPAWAKAYDSSVDN